MAANKTEMNVKNADAVPSFERALKVLGSELNQHIIVAMTAKTTVHSLWLVIVLRYLALTSTCRPWPLLENCLSGSILTYLDEGVVQDKHNGSSIPCPCFTPEQHLPDITDITNFGMAKAEFP
jgi:hypothetical protein